MGPSSSVVVIGSADICLVFYFGTMDGCKSQINTAGLAAGVGFGESFFPDFFS